MDYSKLKYVVLGGILALGLNQGSNCLRDYLYRQPEIKDEGLKKVILHKGHLKDTFKRRNEIFINPETNFKEVVWYLDNTRKMRYIELSEDETRDKILTLNYNGLSFSIEYYKNKFQRLNVNSQEVSQEEFYETLLELVEAKADKNIELAKKILTIKEGYHVESEE